MLPNWKYYKEITISNSNSTALIDYQVKIELDNGNFDFSKANSDGSDIRFIANAYNTIPYWIESWDSSGQTATIWIKVSNVDANSNKTIRVYYGNPTATSESNGDNVFIFFDDFEINLNKWSQTKTSSTSIIQQTTVKAYKGSHAVEVYQTKDDGDTILSKDLIGTGILEIKFYDNIDITGSHTIGDSNFYAGLMNSKNNYYWRTGASWVDTNIARSAGWHAFKFIFSGTDAKVYIDNILGGSTTSIIKLSAIVILDAWTVSGPGLYQDLIITRGYISNKPTVSVGKTRVNSDTLFFSNNF